MLPTPLALLIAALLPQAAQQHIGSPPADRVAIVTAYCRYCSGPIGCRDNALHYGDIAADPDYHRYGDVIEFRGMGTFRVRDTGGAIIGRDRFDLFRAWGDGKCHCAARWGTRSIRYKVVTGR